MDYLNRPQIVDRRARVGDWEGDTVMGKDRRSALLTVVERKTLYMLIGQIMGKRADLLIKMAVKAMMPMKEGFQSLMLDNGL